MEPNPNIRMALLKVRPLTSTTCRRPSHSGDDFRKTACSVTRAYWPVNRPLPAKSRTTNLGPFGEVIRATGPMAKVNPLRFSTKYQDDESDLLYYGYRHYKSPTGTWLNRDPVVELGFHLVVTGDQAFGNGTYDNQSLNNVLNSSGFNAYTPILSLVKKKARIGEKVLDTTSPVW